MNIYEILGVAPDSSIEDIRKAYQEKLKQIDMSRNINEYQDLREAYNTALKQIDQSKATVTIEDIPVKVSEHDTNSSLESPIESHVSLDDVTLTSTDYRKLDITIWSELFHQFINKKEYYNDLKGWENLLASPSLIA